MTDLPAEKRRAAQPRLPLIALSGQPSGLPNRQHAWTATGARDQFGKRAALRFDVLRRANYLVPDRAHRSFPSLTDGATA